MAGRVFKALQPDYDDAVYDIRIFCPYEEFISARKYDLQLTRFDLRRANGGDLTTYDFEYEKK